MATNLRFQFHKEREIPWPAELRSISQEGLWELVISFSIMTACQTLLFPCTNHQSDQQFTTNRPLYATRHTVALSRSLPETGNASEILIWLTVPPLHRRQWNINDVNSCDITSVSFVLVMWHFGTREPVGSLFLVKNVGILWDII